MTDQPEIFDEDKRNCREAHSEETGFFWNPDIFAHVGRSNRVLTIYVSRPKLTRFMQSVSSSKKDENVMKWSMVFIYF